MSTTEAAPEQVAAAAESSVIEAAAPVTIKLNGNPDNRYCLLPPRSARLLGLVPVEGARHELRLADGADPNGLLVLPNGSTFTAFELTTLRHKAYRDTPGRQQGWEIDVDDPCGY